MASRFDTGAVARRTITLDTGRRKVEAPVDVLGRERWRAKLDEQDVRAKSDDDGSSARFFGHASVFNKRTWIGPRKYGFYERVAEGAFEKTLPECDCRFLINHDPNLLLARNKSGTLKLSVDKVGLVTEADLDRRQSYTNDLVISLERGDVTQMSFAFEVIKDSWELDDEDNDVRTIEEVRLWDVSAVTYPAYEDTDAALRALGFDELCRDAGLTDEQRTSILHKIAGTLEVPVLGQQQPAEQDSEPGSSTRGDSQPGSSTGDPQARERRLHLAGLSARF